MAEIMERPTSTGRVVRRMTLVDWLTTTGLFFAIGGVMALLTRAQVSQLGLAIVTPGAYKQLFTMHGSIMLLLYTMPFFTGIANMIMPVQIGAPDVAFPRLTALSF